MPVVVLIVVAESLLVKSASYRLRDNPGRGTSEIGNNRIEAVLLLRYYFNVKLISHRFDPLFALTRGRLEGTHLVKLDSLTHSFILTIVMYIGINTFEYIIYTR